jgi:hypothetical protein
MEATGALHKVLQHSEDTIIVLGAQIIETAATRDMLHLLAHDPRLHILMVRVVNTLGLNTKEPLFNVLSRAFLCHCNRHHSVHTLYHAEVRTQLYRVCV